MTRGGSSLKAFNKRKAILLTLAFLVVLTVAGFAWFAMEVRSADFLIEKLLSGDEAARKAAHDKLVERRGRIVVSRLVTALGDKDNHKAVMPVLAEIGPDAVGRLLAATCHETDHRGWLEFWWGKFVGTDRRSRDVRWSAARDSLRSMGAAAVPSLVEALGSRRMGIRRRAVEFLCWSEDERAVEPLIVALGDGDSDVRWSAAYALGELGDERAVGPLIVALGDEDGSVRQSAMATLGKLGDKRAVGPLIVALVDEDGFVRRRAAWTLGMLGDDRALKPLIAALGDKEKRVRSGASWALGRLVDKRALEPLVAALGDEASRVRRSAARALGALGDERALEPLIVALGDESGSVRSYAAWALGQLGSRRAEEALIKALATSDKRVAATTCGALLSVGGEEAQREVEARLDGIDLSYVMKHYARIIAEGDSRHELALLVALEKSADSELARHLYCSGNEILSDGAESWTRRVKGSSGDLRVWKQNASCPKWGEGKIEK